MIFDFHFHLLFKHLLTATPDITKEVRTTGIASILDEIFGGALDSQSSPAQISKSKLKLGVVGLISLEHAFANRVLRLAGRDFSGILPLDRELFEKTKLGQTNYHKEFNDQVQFYLDAADTLQQEPYRIKYLNRSEWQAKDRAAIEQALGDGDSRYMAFSIEGGHNLSDVPIRGAALARYPDLRLKELQDRQDVDIISINLCHLSEIPEQPLGGFAQGMNKTARIAFYSEDFMPQTGLGLTELGKKVIRQALTHPTKPILIDVKHMSLYTRLHYYRYREQLIEKDSSIERLPLISSHTGFTFTSVSDYLGKKLFRTVTDEQGAKKIRVVEPENRIIGRTDDKVNKRLYCNPWTINLFDEEIIEIMASGGLIGISLDQRVLGAGGFVDSRKRGFFEGEHVAVAEWERLFRDGQRPSATEGIGDWFRDIAPSRHERHVMLLCLHLVHAVRLGYQELAWEEGTSPWDRLCIGSDFDGIINPINRIDTVQDLDKLRQLLRTYLPQADRYLHQNAAVKALDYDSGGRLNTGSLNNAIDKFMFQSGKAFMVRFLKNWH